MFGNCFWLIGFNYVWGWESNCIVCEVVEGFGGMVVGEKYLYLRNSNVIELIEVIFSIEVDFVFNNLVGEIFYVFLCVLDEVCFCDWWMLVVFSCNFIEVEVVEVVLLRVVCLFFCGLFFESVDFDFCVW